MAHSSAVGRHPPTPAPIKPSKLAEARETLPLSAVLIVNPGRDEMFPLLHLPRGHEAAVGERQHLRAMLHTVASAVPAQTLFSGPDLFLLPDFLRTKDCYSIWHQTFHRALHGRTREGTVSRDPKRLTRCDYLKEGY